MGGHDLVLTHWGRVTHICVSKLTIIGSDNGLSPGRRQAFIWTNAAILLIRPLGTNLNEILIEITTFPFMKMRLKESSAKWRPFCLDLNVLNTVFLTNNLGKDHLYTKIEILNLERDSIESQWRSWSTGVIWSNFLFLVTSRAAVFIRLAPNMCYQWLYMDGLPSYSPKFDSPSKILKMIVVTCWITSWRLAFGITNQ